MTCEETQTLLLQADAVDAALDAHVIAHVITCPACAALAARLRRLEGAAASLPPPPGAAVARTRFEEKLRTTPRTLRRSIWRITPARIAIAATLLIASGVGIWAYRGNQNQAIASADTIDQLVEMNLLLSQSNSPDERHQLLAKNTADLKGTLGRAPVADEDREIADALLKDAPFLADNRDPLAEADHFGEVAGLVIDRIDRTARISAKALDRLSKTYSMLVDRGVNRNLARAQGGILTEAQQLRLEKVLARQAKLQVRLERLLEQAPEAQKPQIRALLDLTQTPRGPLKKAAMETF